MQVQFSLISCGPQQQDIKDVCKGLGIGLIAYSPLGLGMLTGKYDLSAGRLPQGPRGILFRQILPGLEPLLGTMEAIAQERRKSVSQVNRKMMSRMSELLQGLTQRTCMEACPNRSLASDLTARRWPSIGAWLRALFPSQAQRACAMHRIILLLCHGH